MREAKKEKSRNVVMEVLLMCYGLKREILTELAGQRWPAILLSLCSGYEDNKYMVISDFLHGCWGVELVIMHPQQALFQLSHFYSPLISLSKKGTIGSLPLGN